MLCNEYKKVQYPASRSQDSEGPLLFLAIAGTDVHPSLLAGFTIGRRHFVIDGGDTGSPERVVVCVVISRRILP